MTTELLRADPAIRRQVCEQLSNWFAVTPDAEKTATLTSECRNALAILLTSFKDTASAQDYADLAADPGGMFGVLDCTTDSLNLRLIAQLHSWIFRNQDMSFTGKRGAVKHGNQYVVRLNVMGNQRTFATCSNWETASQLYDCAQFLLKKWMNRPRGFNFPDSEHIKSEQAAKQYVVSALGLYNTIFSALKTLSEKHPEGFRSVVPAAHPKKSQKPGVSFDDCVDRLKAMDQLVSNLTKELEECKERITSLEKRFRPNPDWINITGVIDMPSPKDFEPINIHPQPEVALPVRPSPKIWQPPV